MKKGASDIAWGELTRLVAYNKLDGLLTWQISRSRLAKAGSEAGTFAHDGTVVVGVQGKTYAASRLIWLLVTGSWPTGKLRFRDGDPANLRWSNLYEENATLSPRHANVYQRRRRKIVKIALERIRSDPSLVRAYDNPQNAGERGILKKIAAEVEDDFLRNNIDPATRPTSVSRKRCPK
jgi:hypothetical protein